MKVVELIGLVRFRGRPSPGGSEEGCPVRLVESQAGRDGTSRYFRAFRPEPGDTAPARR